MLNKQSRLFKNFKKHGYKVEDKMRLDSHRDVCNKTIEKSRENYLRQVGMNLADPNTSKRAYWKIMNRIMNKCKASKIPPILSDNSLLSTVKKKPIFLLIFFLINVSI